MTKLSTVDAIPSVNFHLWEPCNMKCGFCFATFRDVKQQVLPKGHMGRNDCLSAIEKIAEAGFRKINFAGGEPTLCPWLSDLVRRASELGMTTAVVTNGTGISVEWLETVQEFLDWATLSIDTVDEEKMKVIGRTTRRGPLTEVEYLRIAGLVCEFDIRLKVNTVVSSVNWEEDFTGFIAQVRPERWKLFQVLPIRGQNDMQVGKFVVSEDQFGCYVERNRKVEDLGIVVIPESNELMSGSYVMVDPAGRFFDNVDGFHNYSRFILRVGVDEALKDISVVPERFIQRGGRYEW